MRYSVFVAPSGTTCASSRTRSGASSPIPWRDAVCRSVATEGDDSPRRRLSRRASRVHGARGSGNVRDVRRGSFLACVSPRARDARDVNRIERTRAARDGTRTTRERAIDGPTRSFEAQGITGVGAAILFLVCWVVFTVSGAKTWSLQETVALEAFVGLATAS